MSYLDEIKEILKNEKIWHDTNEKYNIKKINNKSLNYLEKVLIKKNRNEKE